MKDRLFLVGEDTDWSTVDDAMLAWLVETGWPGAAEEQSRRQPESG